MLFHHRIISRMVKRTWKHPHWLITPVIESIESRCGYNLKFQFNFRIHCHLPANTVFCFVQIRVIKNPKTPFTVRALAIAWSFRSGC
jgi:hypothetical protein